MVFTDNFLDGAVVAAQDDVDANFTDGAIGTDDTAEDSSQTGLGNEVLRKDRADINKKSVSNGSGEVTCSFFVNSTEANGNTIKEFGWFDSDSGGEMQTRDVFQGIDKTTSIELFVEFDVNITVQEV